jgi:uncharacterized protein Yka (UPF0111/DUF47 family)
MLKIKEIITKMDDTLEEAEWYAKQAKLDKELNPLIAETYYKLGQEHLNHYMSLHNLIVSIITEHRKSKGEPPAVMTAIWNYEHEKLMDDYNEIKRMLDSFR